MSNINSTIIAMADTILAQLSADNNLGVVTSPDNMYEKVLPEDLSIETVNRVSDHNTNFVAASTRAFGQMAQSMMTDNRKLDTVIGAFSMGANDNLSLHYNRSKDYPVPGQEEKSTKYGVVNIAYEVKAGKNGGELKKVRAELAELAMKAFGDK